MPESQVESLFQEKEDVSLCPESTGVDRPISRAGGDVWWWTCGIGSPLRKKIDQSKSSQKRKKKTAQKNQRIMRDKYVRCTR